MATLAEFTQGFIDRSLSIGQRAAEQIVISVRRLDQFAGHHVEVHELSRDLLCRFLRRRLTTCSAFTVKRNRAHLIQLWREAAEEGLVTPPPKIPAIKLPKPVPRAISLDVITRLLGAAGCQTSLMRNTQTPSSLFWRAAILFIYDVGVRLTAMLDIERGDIDITNRIVVLRHDSAKTMLGQVLDFSEQTAEAIGDLMQANGGKHVWEWPYRKRMIWLHFKRLMVAAGLQPENGVAFHALRKSHASYTMLVSDQETARKRMGHTSALMTERYIDPRIIVANSARLADRLPRP